MAENSDENLAVELEFGTPNNFETELILHTP